MEIPQQRRQQQLGRGLLRTRLFPLVLLGLLAATFTAFWNASAKEIPRVSFAVALPELEGSVTFGIFTPSGSLARLLYNDAAVDAIPAGLNGLLMSWDGKDDQGETLPPGSYRGRGLVHGPLSARSEERRVGKECRSRWSPYHHKKNEICITTDQVS